MLERGVSNSGDCPVTALRTTSLYLLKKHVLCFCSELVLCVCVCVCVCV